MSAPVAKKPFLKKGGGVPTKSKGVSGKSDAKKAEDQSRLAARAEKRENRDKPWQQNMKKGGANSSAPGGKDGFKPGTSVKDRIAAWEDKTGGNGGKTGGPGTGVAAKDDTKPAENGAATDTKPDEVLDGKKDPSPAEVDKKLDEGKKDPSLWDRIKDWVGGLFGKKDMSPSEVEKVEEQEKEVAKVEEQEQPVGGNLPSVVELQEPPAPGVPAPHTEETAADTETPAADTPAVDVPAAETPAETAEAEADAGGGSDLLGDLKGQATGALDEASGALGDAVAQGETAVSDKVGEIEGQVGDTVKGAEDMVSGKVGEAEKMVGDKVGEVEGQAGAAIKGAEDTVSGAVTGAEDAVGAKVEETENAIADKWKESPARAMAAKLIGADNMDKVDNAIAGGYKELKGKAKKKYEKMKAKAAKKYAKLKAKAGDMYEGAKGAVSDKYQELKGKAGDMYQGAKDKVGDMYQGAKDKVKGAWDGAKGFAKKLKFW